MCGLFYNLSPCGQQLGSKNKPFFLKHIASGHPLLCFKTACRTTHHDQDSDRENRETTCLLFHSRLQQYENFLPCQDPGTFIDALGGIMCLKVFGSTVFSFSATSTWNLTSSFTQSLKDMTDLSVARSFNQWL